MSGEYAEYDTKWERNEDCNHPMLVSFTIGFYEGNISYAKQYESPPHITIFLGVHTDAQQMIKI